MTSQRTPKTLGGLEFAEIKQSLNDYLKTQEIFAGYNFEGSAIQTVIDMLAYNTFYYAYYANMINAEAFLDSAQKEDSVISLCKPLGYFVPSRKCPRALVQVSGSTNTSTGITAGTIFTSKDEDGIPYNFYAIENIIISEGGVTDPFYIYEGTRYVEFDALPNFDLDEQIISVVDTNFDIDTLKVTVTELLPDLSEDEPREWKRVSNIGYVSQVNEKIYFVERTSTGFLIRFGLKNSLGKTIDDTVSKINIRYLTTSGSDANGLIIFENVALNGNVSVETISQSRDGMSNPNLDNVRFLAPKWFASQERAVTVNDYKALLVEADYFENDTQFNVFGGQDLSPPKYGRVFITSNIDFTEQKISEFIGYVKDKSVITVLPEYITPNPISLFLDFSFRIGPTVPNTNENKAKAKILLKSLFDNNFAVFNQFNLNFSSYDFVDYIKNKTEAATNDMQALIDSLILNLEDFNLYIRQIINSGKEYFFNFGNEFYAPIQQYTDLSEPFDYYGDESSSNRKVVIRVFPTSNSSKNNKLPLQLWAIDDETAEETKLEGDFGYCIIYKGSINIKNDVIRNFATLNIQFKNKAVNMGLDNLITFKTNNITVL